MEKNGFSAEVAARVCGSEVFRQSSRHLRVTDRRSSGFAERMDYLCSRFYWPEKLIEFRFGKNNRET